MLDLKAVNEALSKYVRPQTFPVAIRMCSPGENVPEMARHPKRDLGLHVPLCNAIAIARRYGWVMTIDHEQSCWVASACLGFLPIKEDVADGTMQERLGIWGHKKEEAAKFLDGLTKFEYGRYDRVLVAPLHRASFEPEVVLVYGTPAQIWLLVSGYLLVTGEFSLAASLSMGAGCITYVAKTMRTDAPQFGLLGVGERFNHAQDHECSLSIPISKVETFVEGLSFGHKVGVYRYPVPSFLRYDAEHPPGYDKMLEYLKS